MTPGERARRLIERLPLLFQAGPRLWRIFEALGRELTPMEDATRRLLESRWGSLASAFEVDDSLTRKADSDLGAIGALINLRPGPGESAEYFRRRITEVFRLHARGLSNASAILQLVSFVYLAEQPPKIELREGGALGRFRVPGLDGTIRDLLVELVDNPLSARSVRFTDVGANEEMITCNAGLDDAHPSVDIKASRGNLDFPLLHHEESGLDVVVLDTIESGKTLTLRPGSQPLLDGNPFRGTILVANPTRFALSTTDDSAYRFNAPETRFSVCERANRLPSLPPGETRWRYKPMSRAALAAYVGLDPELRALANAAPESPVHGAASITFRWCEVTPGTFELRIPVSFIPPRYHFTESDEAQRTQAFLRDIQAAIEYGRAAGVRATVGMMLSFPTETLSVDDRPLSKTLDIKLAESQAIHDAVPQLGSKLKLEEQLTQAEDRFRFGGIYNVTRYDDSSFR